MYGNSDYTSTRGLHGLTDRGLHKVHKVYKKPKIMKKRVHEPFFFLGPFVDPWPPYVHHRKTSPHCGPWPGYYPCWQLNERNGSSGGPQGN